MKNLSNKIPDVMVIMKHLLGIQSFCDYKNLENIILPNGLEKIDFGVFHDLKKLVINKNANFDKLALYSGNNSLSEMTIIENTEAEKAVKYAIKMKAVPENVKIFHSVEEYNKYVPNKKYPVKIVDVKWKDLRKQNWTQKRKKFDPGFD